MWNPYCGWLKASNQLSQDMDNIVLDIKLIWCDKKKVGISGLNCQIGMKRELWKPAAHLSPSLVGGDYGCWQGKEGEGGRPPILLHLPPTRLSLIRSPNLQTTKAPTYKTLPDSSPNLHWRSSSLQQVWRANRGPLQEAGEYNRALIDFQFQIKNILRRIFFKQNIRLSKKLFAQDNAVLFHPGNWLKKRKKTRVPYSYQIPHLSPCKK